MRWGIFLKSSYQHRQVSDEIELLTMKGFQPDLLRLFEDILQDGSSLRVRVTGRSMMPFLKGGELLTLRQAPCPSLQKGDLVLFRNAYDLPVLHRIIKKRKTGYGTFCFLTKGDALLAFDEEVDGKNILGKVLKIERPALSGKSRNIDMNSKYHKNINFLIALLGLFKTQAYFFLSGVVAKRT